MTTPSNEMIVQQVAKCAELLDTRNPGWAHKVPLTEVDVARVEKSPLAFLIGMDWDTKIAASSAIQMGVFTPYTAVAEVANRAWQRQIAMRRSQYSVAS